MSVSKLDNAISEIMDIRSRYIRERAIFVPGDQVTSLLATLGATDEDLEQIKLVSDNLAKDPTLPFRESRNGRFCIDFDKSQAYRLEFQPFVLSAEEDFVRYDSGEVRKFEEIGDDLQLNSALQALFKFKSLIINGVSIKHRPKLDYTTNKWVCTLFNLRTLTTPELTGEPALEGVHSDGVDHTMTTFLGSRNTTDDSAVTYIHDMREKNATRWNETDPSLAIGSWQHRDFMDTLLIVDHERKHSLSPVSARDKEKTTTRDMLIFFTRKPVTEDHISYSYDSLDMHEALPMSLNLPTAIS
jgi:hypothetical protein